MHILSILGPLHFSSLTPPPPNFSSCYGLEFTLRVQFSFIPGREMFKFSHSTNSVIQWFNNHCRSLAISWSFHSLYYYLVIIIFYRSLASNGGLPNLQYLDLSGCLNVTAQGLIDLVSVCPSLDHAQFFYCDNIYEGPYQDTASGCQNLECMYRVCCRLG